MKLSSDFKITMSYRSRALAGWEEMNPRPSYPSVGEDQVDTLIEKLRKAGIEVDRQKSQKKLSVEGGVEALANFDEAVEGHLNELVFVSDNLQVAVKNYHDSHSDGRMGGYSNHVNGIFVNLVYSGDNQEQGQQMLDQAREVVDGFYQPMCKVNYPTSKAVNVDLLKEAKPIPGILFGEKGKD